MWAWCSGKVGLGVINDCSLQKNTCNLIKSMLDQNNSIWMILLSKFPKFSFLNLKDLVWNPLEIQIFYFKPNILFIENKRVFFWDLISLEHKEVSLICSKKSDFFYTTYPTLFIHSLIYRSFKILCNLFFLQTSPFGVCSSMKLVSSLRFVRNDQVLSCRRCQAFISSLIEQCFSVVQNTCLWVRLSPWDKALTSDKIVTVQNHTAVMLKASTDRKSVV